MSSSYPTPSKKFRLQEHGGSIVITIPREVVKRFQLEKGKALDVSRQGSQLIIDLPPDQDIFLLERGAAA
jgi:antitoxin component of MazEF toxin-antitoxin module